MALIFASGVVACWNMHRHLAVIAVDEQNAAVVELPDELVLCRGERVTFCVDSGQHCKIVEIVTRALQVGHCHMLHGSMADALTFAGFSETGEELPSSRN